MTIYAAYGCNVDSGIHRMGMFEFPEDLERGEKTMDSTFKPGTDCNVYRNRPTMAFTERIL